MYLKFSEVLQTVLSRETISYQSKAAFAVLYGAAVNLTTRHSVESTDTGYVKNTERRNVPVSKDRRTNKIGQDITAPSPGADVNIS